MKYDEKLPVEYTSEELERMKVNDTRYQKDMEANKRLKVITLALCIPFGIFCLIILIWRALTGR